MNKKNLVRTVVLLGLVAWPAVESYRLWEARQDLASRQKVESKVTTRLAMAKAKNAQLATVAPDPVEPK
jgi:regulatory protein YycH of two-component signal transduction system YycFG